ncbi:hypothetical protein HOY80DRAFT_980537 [Tuber brumale]|nr:hypothetical protein HOY80DRAFT_980537 [Tuber brumale]
MCLIFFFCLSFYSLDSAGDMIGVVELLVFFFPPFSINFTILNLWAMVRYNINFYFEFYFFPSPRRDCCMAFVLFV